MFHDRVSTAGALSARPRRRCVVPAALLLAAAALASPPPAGAAGAPEFPAALEITAGARIAFEGDSLIYGQDETETGGRPPINGAPQGRSAKPLPEHLGELLERRVQVENRGFPGDRSIDGLSRWDRAGEAALVFIMYGTNDASNFGGRPGGVVSPAAFTAALGHLVARRATEGSAVVLMAPPPVGVAEWEARTAPYRAAVARVAEEHGVPVLDTSEVLAGVRDKWTDGLHLSGRSLEALACFLVGRIRIVEPGEGNARAR